MTRSGTPGLRCALLTAAREIAARLDARATIDPRPAHLRRGRARHRRAPSLHDAGVDRLRVARPPREV